MYKNRNHKEAKVFIKKLLKHINLNSYSKVLDAGCGKGRHSIEIEKLGHKVTGIDLSNNSIKFAKKFENSNLKFKVHDISKPLNTEFDVVLNLFTSFGYYEREKDLEILLSLEKNLKDNGIGVIDFLNIKTVKVNLVKDEQVIIDDLKFNIKRKINKIFDLGLDIKDEFSPSKSIMSRYSKKVINPKFYGTIEIKNPPY